MNKFLLLGAATAALICASGSAFAGSPTATSTVNLTGTSPTVCTLDVNPTVNASSGSGSSFSLSGNTLTVTSLFDTTDSHIVAGSTTLRYVGMCNYAHNVSIKSTNGVMVNGAFVAPVGGTFVERVGYAANFTWAGSSATTGILDKTSTSANAAFGAQTSSDTAIAGANAGNLDVTLDFAANANPVVSGTYTDVLTAQIGADL